MTKFIQLPITPALQRQARREFFLRRFTHGNAFVLGLAAGAALTAITIALASL